MTTWAVVMILFAVMLWLIISLNHDQREYYQALSDRVDRLRLALGDDPDDALARVAMASRDCVTFQARIGEVERRFREIDDMGFLTLRDDRDALFRRVATMRGDLDVAELGIEKLGKRLTLHDDAAGLAFWRSADGHVYRLRDLGDSHLKRILRRGEDDDRDASGVLRTRMQDETARRARAREIDRQMDELETGED